MNIRLKIFVFSVVLSVISISFSMAISLTEVVVHENKIVSDSEMQKIFTTEELDRRSQEAEILVREAIEKHRMENKNRIFLDETKVKAAWVSWIPWFFLAFIFKQVGPKHLVLAAAFPVLVFLIGGFVFFELVFFLLASILGYIVSRKTFTYNS